MSLELAEETIKHLGNKNALVLKNIIDNFDYQKHEMDYLMALCLIMIEEDGDEEE